MQKRINPLASEPDAGRRGTWSRGEPPIDPLIPSSQNVEKQTPRRDLFFRGISNPFACGDCAPPDAGGAVGTHHFVQVVNRTRVGIYRKANGALLQRFDLGDLWSSGQCTRGRGDPVVLFDGIANRWLLAQSAGPSHLCFAISRTANPSGAYYLYTFNVGEFPDYFKVGVWPNGYYVSASESTYTAYVFDRTRMLNGDAGVRFIKFTGQTNFLLPADIDGSSQPNGGGLFYTFKDDAFHGGRDRIELFQLTPNFASPASSKFRLKSKIRIAPFTYTVCGFFRFNCIRQKGTAQKLDAVSEWPMNRFVYREVGSRPSLVGNFTVGGGKGSAGAAIRWFELRKVGSSSLDWILLQQGTHDLADGLDRFMGSIAMDKDGNIALGYSASSSAAFPSIRYAARSVRDPLGTLRQEKVLKAGGGSQTGSNRWGSYSAMTVDPVGGCEFWYTNEFYTDNSASAWKTGVGTFKLASCGPRSGFPDASNTGVPPGVTLTSSGALNIRKRGAVVSGVDVTGHVEINAPNVTLKNCKIRATTWAAVIVMAPGVVIEDCEISSIYTRGGSKGIWFEGVTGGTARRNNIHHVEDGFYISANDIVVEDNYIHDSESYSYDPHYDGIQISAGSAHITVRHNNVDTTNPEQNSAITMGNNEGPLDDVLVEDNRFVGGGYTTRCDGRGSNPVGNIRILNNRIRRGVYGYTAFDGLCNPLFKGNVDEVTGKPLVPD